MAVIANDGSYTSTITLSSDPNLGFDNIGATWIGQGPVEIGGGIYQFGVAGYATGAAQAIVFGHELGHAADFAGYQSAVVPDTPGNVEDFDLSNQNNEAVGNACFPQGDTDGNGGPLDQGGDIPAVAKRARIFH
jgi:hypothetical protein